MEAVEEEASAAVAAKRRGGGGSRAVMEEEIVAECHRCTIVVSPVQGTCPLDLLLRFLNG